jgi:hypothetical protein
MTTYQRTDNTGQVAVILTVWKRDHLREQIEALLQQSLPPSEIWIYHCCRHVRPALTETKQYPFIKYQFNSADLGYFGRFSLGLQVDTPYLLVMDDDVIPSSRWLEECRELCSQQNVIVSPAGRIIPRDNYSPEKISGKDHLARYFFGDGDNGSMANRCEANTIVDFGCNSWFIRTEWLQYFWSVKPYSRLTGEDIHLSASSLLLGGIRTLCPRQEENGLCGNRKKEYGFDQIASWRQPGFIPERKKILEGWIKEKGWRPLHWKDTN